MGLDIYLHKAKRRRGLSKSEFKHTGFKYAVKVADEYNRKLLKKAIERVQGKLKAAKSLSTFKYGEIYNKEVRKLFKYFNYPDFFLKEIGVTQDYSNDKYTITPKDEVFDKAVVDKIVEKSYSPYIAYFRKVNFIYRFFDSRGLIDHDCECAWADRDVLQELVDMCAKVIDKPKKAEECLPTQSGFFFGSIDYDKYYFDDVKNCYDQISKVLKGLKEDEQCYFLFSW